jgi:hypothetical protein
MTWGTLSSRHAKYDLVLRIDEVAHDYPVTEEQFLALRSIDVGKAVACLDATLW